MTEPMETVMIKGEGVTVDLLVWRRYRRRMEGMVERIFALNDGLARMGPVLPVGMSVKIPSVPQSALPKTQVTIKLWD